MKALKEARKGKLKKVSIDFEVQDYSDILGSTGPVDFRYEDLADLRRQVRKFKKKMAPEWEQARHSGKIYFEPQLEDDDPLYYKI